MKKMSVLGLACLGAVCSVNSFAQTGDKMPLYVDLGYTMIDYSEPGASASPKAFRLVVGKNITENWGVEGLLAASAGSSSTLVKQIKVDFKVSSMYGVYAKAFTKINDNLELFGRLGFASVTHQASSSSNGVTKNVEDSGSGVSYGAGVKYKIKDNMNVFADYMAYYPERDGISNQGFTLGVGFSF